MASDKADGLTHDEWERAEEIVRKSRGDTSYEMLGQVDYARALLLAHATIEKQALVVKAARKVRETDKAWMGAGAPDYGDLANAAADAHVRLESAIDAIDKETP